MKVEVTHVMDGDIPIVLVPLTNSEERVSVNQSDFDALIKLGLDPLWKLENGYIRERGTKLSVTRLVADARQGEKVNLLDGNPCNLRQGNIYKTRGGNGGNAREKLASTKRADRVVKLQRNYNNPAWFKELAK